MDPQPQLFAGRNRIHVRALLVGERIDVRALDGAQKYASLPTTIAAGDSGCAVLLRYGVVVLFDVGALQETSFLNHLRHLVSEPAPQPEVEETDVQFEPSAEETVEGGVIRLSEASIERLQVVADILAKSVMLSHYEATIAGVFDRVEPLAGSLERSGKSSHQGPELMRHLGGILLIQHRMVGRVEVGEKPEILWDRPKLERLFLRLEDEYELSERHRALERKLDVVARTAETLLDLLRNRSSLRVEWYIVVLILLEIFLTVYQMLIKH